MKIKKYIKTNENLMAYVSEISRDKLLLWGSIQQQKHYHQYLISFSPWFAFCGVDFTLRSPCQYSSSSRHACLVSKKSKNHSGHHNLLLHHPEDKESFSFSEASENVCLCVTNASLTLLEFQSHPVWRNGANGILNQYDARVPESILPKLHGWSLSKGSWWDLVTRNYGN